MMTQSESLDESVLNSYGGLHENSLSHLIRLDDGDDGNPQTVIHSSYYDQEKLTELIVTKKKHFSILSSNIESINAKYSELEIFIEQLKQQNFKFSAICLQECWLSKKNINTSLIELEGYHCIKQSSNISNKGGLVIYLSDEYQYKMKSSYNVSEIWEGQFIEVSGNDLTKNIIIGNIYRPPRNLTNNYRVFIDEITLMLNSYDRCKSEIILTGDFNINLLKINEREIFSEFYDTMISHGYCPKITLPTRFSNRNGTLIDNFFCKNSNSTISATSGIMIKQFSDHHPYFMFMNILKQNIQTPKYIQISSHTQNAIDRFYCEIESTNILDKMNKDPLADPNDNYNILEKIIYEARHKHLPIKNVKFNRHRHKKICGSQKAC